MRIRQRGSSSVSALAVVAATGLVGTAYYGYHKHNTGHAIKKLVPEWQVAQAPGGKSLAPPVCTKDPPDHAYAHSVPGFRFEAEVPGAEEVCPLLGLPKGKVKVTVESREQQIAPYRTVGKTCLEHFKADKETSGRLSGCSLTLQLRGRQYADAFQHRCKTCVKPPERSCTGLMCRMSTEAFSLLASGGVEKDFKDKKRKTNILSSKVRLELNGLQIRAGRHTVKNGTDPACGDCSDEVIGGVSGVARPDCVRETLNLPLGSEIRLTGEGSFALGPLKGVYAAQARITTQLTVAKNRGQCKPPYCMTGSAEISAGHEGRAHGGGRWSGAVTVFRQSCAGRWVATGCSGPGTPGTKTWKCNRVVTPGAGGGTSADDYLF